MNADGTDQINITSGIPSAGQSSPDWRPFNLPHARHRIQLPFAVQGRAKLIYANQQFALLRQSDASHQLTEARVGTQVVKLRHHVEVH